MIPGHTTLGGIEKALADLRAQEADANGRLDDAMRRLAENRATETEQFRDLAAFRMKTDQGLGATLGRAATQVRAILALRANDRETMGRTLANAEARVSQLADERQTLAEELTAAEEARRTVANDAHVRLAAKDQTYPTLRADAETAWRVAQAADAKAKTAETELDEKRKPYEADPLFMYLWGRRYATGDYTAGPAARFFDGWVARLVRYDGARANFAMLNEIPKRLREHADRTKATAVDLVERLKVAETSAYAAAGGAQADAAVSAAQKRLDDMDARRAAAETDLDQAREAIAAFGRGDDPRYREAVTLLAETLRGEDLNRLYQAALATPSPDDEAMVKRIASARDAQGAIDDETKRIRTELATISRRRSEVGEIATAFRKRRYDTDGSYFDDDVVGSLLRGVVTGVLTGADYWNRMERSRRWHRPAPQSSGTVILPFPTGDWGGSSWGGGSWGGGSGGGSWGGGGGGGSWGGGGGSDDGFSTGGRF